MGRAPCCDKTKVKRGPWSPEEDAILKSFLEKHGTARNWIALPHKAGLKRCGKSCRLRWLNYLRPDIKHGGFTEEEDNIICSLYDSIGSRWSIIASQLPGRTDNDVKNYWNTRLKKKLLAGKVSLNSNIINNKDITTNNISQLISSTQTSASYIPKVEICDHGNSSTDFNANPGTWQNEMDMFYHQNFDPEEIILDPSFKVPFPGLMEVSDYSINAHNINYSKSSSQEASSLSISSSPLTLESRNYVSWSANANAEEQATLLDFSFESPYGLLHGFDFPKTSNEVSSSKLIN